MTDNTANIVEKSKNELGRGTLYWTDIYIKPN